MGFTMGLHSSYLRYLSFIMNNVLLPPGANPIAVDKYIDIKTTHLPAGKSRAPGGGQVTTLYLFSRKDFAADAPLKAPSFP
jgi:hypothetical protein